MAFLSERLISAGAKEDPVDDDFNLTTLLIHADGSNGAGNNVSGVSFVDSSDENHSVSDPNADTKQGTFSPFSAEEGKWSCQFESAASNYLQLASSSDFAFGTGDFTIECFVNFLGTDEYSGGIFSLNSFAPAMALRDTTGLTIYTPSAGQKITGNSGLFTVGVWYHLAYVRASGVIKVYKDGSLVTWNDGTSSVSDTGNVTNTNFIIGKYYSDDYTLDGYISNLRVVKGTAVYTSNFTPPTEPLTAITNTVLLTCCSNRFKDKSTSAHRVAPDASGVNHMTSTNLPEVHPFSPYSPSDAYSASVNGGSVYFIKTDNSYLTLSDATDFDFGTGDYTVEMWAYPTDTFNTNWAMAVSTIGVNQYWAWTDGGGTESAAGLSTYPGGGYSGSFDHMPNRFSWSHIVFQNTSGTENWYVNGVRVYNTTNNPSFSASATGLRIGDSPHYSGQFQYGGYLTDIRVVKGSNAYTNGSTITVPTAPLTKITNTKLLLNSTGSAIIDQTGNTNIRTKGLSLGTSQKKFGTASIEYDGTADYLDLSDRSVVPPSGTENFTIECFVYINSHKNYNNIYCAGPYIQFYVNSSGKLATWIARADLQFPVNNFQSTGTISTSTWTHVALVRNGSVYTHYIDGTASGTNSDSTAIPRLSTTNSGYLHFIGAYYSGSYSMDGYIDEFRITKKARYTSNFTAPTEAFLDK